MTHLIEAAETLEINTKLEGKIHRYWTFSLQVGLKGGPTLATFRAAYQWNDLISFRKTSGSCPDLVLNLVKDWVTKSRPDLR